MHPELLRVILNVANAGDRVAIFEPSNEEARALFDRAAIDMPAEVSPVRTVKLHGGQAFHFASGGFVKFHSIRSLARARGTSLDWAYVPLGTDRDTLGELIPSFATSTSGILLGY